MIDALQNYGIHGIKNNINYLNAILHNTDYINNTISTRFCTEHTATLLASIAVDRKSIPESLPLSVALISKPMNSIMNSRVPASPGNIWSTVGYWRIMMQPELEIEDKISRCHITDLKTNELTFTFGDENIYIRYETSGHLQQIEIQLNGEPYTTFVSHPEPGKVIVGYNTHIFEVTRKDVLPAQTDFNTITASMGESGSGIISPMPGKVIKIAVKPGDIVSKGDLLLIVEAMKMENNILSPADAVVDKINVSTGVLVDSSVVLVHLAALQSNHKEV
jgi:acetyl/propionyl-CoA carboxylase alpha subunit